MLNTTNKFSLGRKGFVYYLAYRWQFITEENQSRISDENLQAGPEVEATEECCFLAASSGLLSYPFLDSPGPPAQGQPHPPPWQLRKYRHAQRPMFSRQFLSWESLFSFDSLLGEVGSWSWLCALVLFDVSLFVPSVCMCTTDVQGPVDVRRRDDGCDSLSFCEMDIGLGSSVWAVSSLSCWTATLAP